jgi:hypothetical protein
VSSCTHNRQPLYNAPDRRQQLPRLPALLEPEQRRRRTRAPVTTPVVRATTPATVAGVIITTTRTTRGTHRTGKGGGCPIHLNGRAIDADEESRCRGFVVSESSFTRPR